MVLAAVVVDMMMISGHLECEFTTSRNILPRKGQQNPPGYAPRVWITMCTGEVEPWFKGSWYFGKLDRF